MVLNFNPRSREGSDVVPDADAFFRQISIRAPARGATQLGSLQNAHTVHFNPRSREGSDRCMRRLRRQSPDFNPRSREGSDPGGIFTSVLRLYFNPRSREGSDR